MRHRLAIGAVALVALVALVATAAVATAAPTAQITPPANIAKAGKVVFCMDISFPPFGYFSASNKPIGVEVDLVTAIDNLMGVKTTFRNTQFDGLIPALQSAQCDAIISGLYNKASRRKVVDFVNYAYVGNNIVVGKGNPHHVNGLAGLSGLKVGVESGTTLRLNLLAENKKLAAAGKAPMTVVDFPKDSDAFQQLIAGNVDAYFTSGSAAAYYAKKASGQVQIVGPTLSALPFGIATRKNEKQLHQAFTKGLSILRQNGQYTAIFKKWGALNTVLKG
jgi:polar amino acid transport system substrate-binding protein